MSNEPLEFSMFVFTAEIACAASKTSLRMSSLDSDILFCHHFKVTDILFPTQDGNPKLPNYRSCRTDRVTASVV
jgi:hypothetical protein